MFQEKLEQLGKDVLVSDEQNLHKEKEILNNCDLVIVSVPIDASVDVIKRIKPDLHKEQLLSDFTSVKDQIVPEMLRTDAWVIPSHPMFGPMEDMSGQNMILMPIVAGKFLAKYKRLMEDLKLNVVVMENWKKHDEYMSFIQGLMHFINIVFTQTLRSKDVDLQTMMSICSPVYQSNFAFACRILNRDPHLYTHILMDNPQNLEVLNQFLKNASESYKYIQKKDDETFQKEFMESRDFLGEFAGEFSAQSDYLIKQLKEYEKKS